MSANACVADVTEATNDGTLEQDKLTRRPSANNTILLPSGNMT
jgi:hypothetical protein